MGHVDHGKTSLLDAIRSTTVAAGERAASPSTSARARYDKDGKRIVFLDTPGHEAFTSMRARGARVTDIAVIVVAADDGVMPQTLEAIGHAKAAKVPIVIAINKIDRPEANPDRVKTELAEAGVVVEDYGGDTPLVPVSARRPASGIDELLEIILLVADLQELKANPKRDAVGTVIEAQLDKGRGPVANADRPDRHPARRRRRRRRQHVRQGQGPRERRRQARAQGGPGVGRGRPRPRGRARGRRHPARGRRREDRPRPGRVAQERAGRPGRRRPRPGHARGPLPPDPGRPGQGAADHPQGRRVGLAGCDHPRAGPAGTDEVKINVLLEGNGDITDNDIMLATASNAIVVGFNTSITETARRAAESEGVDVRLYDIIYKLTDDIEAALKGMLEPEIVEVVEGRAEVRQIFRVGKSTVIAGCYVTDGRIVRNGGARVWRGGKIVETDKIDSLRRFRDDVREVAHELRVRHRPGGVQRPRRGRHHRVLHQPDAKPGRRLTALRR